MTALKIISAEGRQSILKILLLCFVVSYTHTHTHTHIYVCIYIYIYTLIYVYVYIYLLVQRRLMLSHTYAYDGEFITHYIRPSRERDRIALKCQFCSVLMRLIGYWNPAMGNGDFLRRTGALFCIDNPEKSRKSQ